MPKYKRNIEKDFP